MSARWFIWRRLSGQAGEGSPINVLKPDPRPTWTLDIGYWTFYLRCPNIPIIMRLPFFALFLCLSFFSLHAQSTNDKLVISHLTGDFYIYTTYNQYEDSRVPANGMYLITKDGVVIFDTPWDTTQFQPLLDSIQARHHQKVIMAIATHWHSDKTAGLEYYRHQGIRTYTTLLTDAFSQKNRHKRAEYLLAGDTVFQVGGYAFETYFPGEGHTADNIVVWFGKEKILYGGCLIKGVDAENLGYLGDANVMEYANTLKRVQGKCRKPRFIVIAHSDWKNKNSLKHSIRLAEKLKKG